MARPAFKRRWMQLIPESTERNTYVFVSGVTCYLLVYLWRPIDVSVWPVSNEYIRGGAWHYLPMRLDGHGVCHDQY